MTLKTLLAAASLSIGLAASPAISNDAIIEGMQDYLMFQDYESGIILPQQVDQTIFDAAMFIDTRDSEQFSEATIPGAIHIEWREVLDWIDEIPQDRMTILFCNTGSLSAQATFALRVAGRSNVVVMHAQAGQPQGSGPAQSQGQFHHPPVRIDPVLGRVDEHQPKRR